MIVRQLFDRSTCTYTYLLADLKHRLAVLIDPVIEHIDRDLLLIEELGLAIELTLETHLHADHITAAGTLRHRTQCTTGLSSAAGAACADLQIADNQRITVGQIELIAIHTPGHTNGCVSYYLSALDCVFTGDTLMIRGCGRTDFQQGSSTTLFNSVRNKLFALPDHTTVYPGHDYTGRTQSSIAEEKTHNPRLALHIAQEQFVNIMENLKLSQPKMIDIAVPANTFCGLPPDKEHDPWAPTRDGSVPEVTVEWYLNTDQEFQLVDCREDNEWAVTHIEGAVHIALSRFLEELGKIDINKDVVVYCRSGKRSITASQHLLDRGIRAVSLRGGILRLQALTQGPGDS